jgi:hypothetical protein
MTETEHVEKRPECVWPVKSDDKTKPCGSQEKVYEVRGQGKWTGRPRNSNICDRHLMDALRDWKWEHIDPCGNGSKGNTP